MKKDIHPATRMVAFQDQGTGDTFLIDSIMPSKETVTLEGTEYPLVKLDNSSASHPFYTGKRPMMDTQGRIDKFRKNYGK